MLNDNDLITDWEQIEDIDEYSADLLRDAILRGKSTVQDVLKVEKYFFKRRFTDNTPT